MSMPSKSVEDAIRSMGQNYSDALDWILIQDEDGINNIFELTTSYLKTNNQFHKAIICILMVLLHEEFILERLSPLAYGELNCFGEKLGI